MYPEKYVLRNRRTSNLSCELDNDVDVIFFPWSIIDTTKGNVFGVLVGYADEQLAADLKYKGMKVEED